MIVPHSPRVFHSMNKQISSSHRISIFSTEAGEPLDKMPPTLPCSFQVFVLTILGRLDQKIVSPTATLLWVQVVHYSLFSFYFLQVQDEHCHGK